MSFIREKISEEDRKKYKIDELEKRNNSYFSSWIIDEENRDCFFFRTGLNKERMTKFWLYYGGGMSEIYAEWKIDQNKPNVSWYEIEAFYKSQSTNKTNDEVLNQFKLMLKKNMEIYHNTNSLKITCSTQFSKKFEVK